MFRVIDNVIDKFSVGTDGTDNGTNKSEIGTNSGTGGVV